MNLLDAFRAVVRGYPGGVQAIALRLGKSDKTLRNELLADGTAKLGLLDAEEMTLMSIEVGSPDALTGLMQFAGNCGQMLVPLPTSVDLGSADCVRGISDLARDFSAMVGEVAGSIADGTVTLNELRACEAKAAQTASSMHAVIRALRQVYRDGQPRSEGKPAP